MEKKRRTNHTKGRERRGGAYWRVKEREGEENKLMGISYLDNIKLMKSSYIGKYSFIIIYHVQFYKMRKFDTNYINYATCMRN